MRNSRHYSEFRTMRSHQGPPSCLAWKIADDPQMERQMTRHSFGLTTDYLGIQEGGLQVGSGRVGRCAVWSWRVLVLSWPVLLRDRSELFLQIHALATRQ